MMRRKRTRPHANHERWLVSYADFITLLFAFFVVLYAAAQVDRAKIGKLAVAIQEAFQQFGVPEADAHSAQPSAAEALQAIEQLKKNPSHELAYGPQDEPDDEAANESNLIDLESELKQALASEIIMQTVALHREREGLVISLREFGFFDSGSAVLRPGALPALDRIATILGSRSCGLRIEGHTDNVPIHTANMPSNWELSTARASELVRLLIVRYGIPPERLSAAGYAQYHPIANNDSADGRAKNRRVDVVVLSGRAEQRWHEKPSPATVK